MRAFCRGETRTGARLRLVCPRVCTDLYKKLVGSSLLFYELEFQVSWRSELSLQRYLQNCNHFHIFAHSPFILSSGNKFPRDICPCNICPGNKIFLPKICFNQKFVSTKKNFGRKFWIFSNQKLIWDQKLFLDQQFFGLETFFDLKFFWCQKLFWIQKCFWGQESFLGPTIL